MNDDTQRSGRVDDGVTRGASCTFTFEGREVEAFVGESVGAALWAAGIRSLRDSVRLAEPRGMFCGMGICFDCLVSVDGRLVRACTTPVAAGLDVRRGGDGAAPE